jgi:hypothetical protein
MRMIQAHGDVIHSGLSQFPDPREFHLPRMSNPDLARALLSTYYYIRLDWMVLVA